MKINSGQISPGPAFFEALRAEPRAPAQAGAQSPAKPSGPTQTARAVTSADGAGRSEMPPRNADGRDFPRGSFVDVRA